MTQCKTQGGTPALAQPPRLSQVDQAQLYRISTLVKFYPVFLEHFSEASDEKHLKQNNFIKTRGGSFNGEFEQTCSIYS